VHKQRNVLNAIPRRERGDVQAELVGIWKQPTKQEALIQLHAGYSLAQLAHLANFLETQQKMTRLYRE
jgi:hypothetical protein